ncbi:hypothetical protein MRX96_021107 [Rhipicephalus microplus]
MADKPADPPCDFSSTTAEPPTGMATTTYDALGQPVLQLHVHAGTQAANQHAALRACCSSPDLQGNPTSPGSKSGPIARSTPPRRNITFHQSWTCQWPSPGNASAPVPSTSDTGSWPRIYPAYVSKTTTSFAPPCSTVVAASPTATTPPAQQPNTSWHVPPHLCAHGSTADAAKHDNQWSIIAGSRAYFEGTRIA